MAKKIKTWLQRSCALVCVMFVLLSCFLIPSSAVSANPPDDDLDPGDVLVPVIPFDLFTDFTYGLKVEYPFSSVVNNTYLPHVHSNFLFGDYDLDYSWMNFSNGYVQFQGPNRSNYQIYTFEVSRPFVMSMADYNMFQNYFSVTTQNSYLNISVDVQIKGKYPSANDIGSYDWYSFSAGFSDSLGQTGISCLHGFADPLGYIIGSQQPLMRILPSASSFFHDVYDELNSCSFFLVQEFTVVIEISASVAYVPGLISFQMPYKKLSAFLDYMDLMEYYPNVEVVEKEVFVTTEKVVVEEDFHFSDLIINVFGPLFDTPIFGILTLGDLLAIFLGVSVLVVCLKYFG